MKRLGDSCDWDRAYFTMDERLSRVVVETFVRLYEQGLIYRGQRLVNWDPALQTAVSDLEVENEEEEGRIWEIRYPGADGSEAVVVATTRPETRARMLSSSPSIRFSMTTCRPAVRPTSPLRSR